MEAKRLSFDLGFAPDADPLVPGVVTDAMNMVPTDRGMRTLGGVYPAASDTTVSATFTGEIVLGHECFDVTQYGIADDYVGTTGKVWRRLGTTGAYSDLSRTAGYTSLGVGCWSFEKFGTYVIAAATTSDGNGNPIGASVLQAGAYGSQLLDIAGAPTCGVITSAERFVLAFNGQGGNNDSWACCARDDHTSWTTSPSTLANAGRLVDPPGPIIAAKPLGNDVVVYKPDAMILGRFTEGDAEVWKWGRMRHRIGALSPRAVCVLDDGRHAIIGRESCYLFDGLNVTDVLDRRARRWYKRVRGTTLAAYQFGAFYDTANKLVWFSFHTDNLGGLGLIALHVATGKLGYCLVPADIAGIVADPLEPGSRVLAYFDDTQKRRWMFARSTEDDLPHANGHPSWESALAPSITSGDIGHPFDLVDINNVQLDVPETFGAYAANSVSLRSRSGRKVTGEVTTAGTHVGSDYERYSARAMNHWHRVTVTPGFAQELSGVYVEGSGFGGRRK